MSTQAALHQGIGRGPDPHNPATAPDSEYLMLVRSSARGAHHSAGVAEHSPEEATLAADTAHVAAQSALASAQYATQAATAFRQSLWMAAALGCGMVVGFFLAVLGCLAVTTSDREITVPAAPVYVQTSSLPALTWQLHRPVRGHAQQSITAATGVRI